MQAEPALINASQREDGYSEQPSYRPLTKFENRGLKLGHGVWDLVFRRA
jgi:tRNA (guanine-N7-)-methyltransferase